jgi:predicted aldo/keto reductase-like oxidoreductase
VVSKTASKTGKDCLADLETSLRELGTDHLDIWYLHARDTAGAISDDCVAAQEAAKKQGKTRFIGVSTHDPNAVADHILKLGKHDAVLFTYSFAMGTSRDAAIAKLHKAGLGLLAMKVATPGGGASEAPGRRAPVTPVRKPGGALAGVKWALKNPAIAAAVVTMMDSDTLTENFRAVTEKLSPSEEKLLAVIDEGIRPYYCRMCYECKGQCPKGMPVTDVLRYLAYADFCRDFPKARQNFAELPAHTQQIRCGDCPSCSVECPNGVRVRERLIRAQEMFA